MADNKSAAVTLVCETQEALYKKAVKKMNADRLIVQFAYKIENYETAASMFDAVGDYADAPQMAKRCRELAQNTREEEKKVHYRRALESQNSAVTEQEYERVEEAFTALGDYQDASEKRQQCLDSIKRIQRKRKRKIEMAVLIFVLCAGAVTAGFATGFFRYLKGIGYYQMELYEKAELAFEESAGLLDSDKRAQMCRVRLESQELVKEKEALRKAKVGDSVSFGADTWRVLERQGDEVLLIMDKVREDSLFRHVPYHESGGTISWEESSLREKLNGEFLTAEFTDQEQESLLPVPANGEAQEGIDRVRILSVDEAEEYSEILSKMTGVDFWLSTPGSQEGTAMFVSGGGMIMDCGYPVDSDKISVRPVIRINCVEAAEEGMR